jgi:hypothetical protein
MRIRTSDQEELSEAYRLTRRAALRGAGGVLVRSLKLIEEMA